MDDRELLELAAKEAGVLGRFIELLPEDGYQAYSCGIGNARVIIPLWNPLINDGDAFRLALAINACIVIDSEMRWCGIHLAGERGKYDLLENFGDDPSRATRRAIVRAAAEIGQRMKEDQA